MELVWSSELELGEPALDANHREFVHLLKEWLEAGDAALPVMLERFQRHAEHHFCEEDELMRRLAYPSAQCHLDEHAAVLKSITEVRLLVGQGDSQVARRLAHELANWFPEHTLVMDSGLAAWAQKQRLGGATIRIVSPRARSKDAPFSPSQPKAAADPEAPSPVAATKR